MYILYVLYAYCAYLMHLLYIFYMLNAYCTYPRCAPFVLLLCCFMRAPPPCAVAFNLVYSTTVG